MSGIFISCRRDDSEGQAGRLFEGLKARFGQHRVFIDVAGIEPGRDFRQVIEEHVGSCDVLPALIVKNWLHAAGKDGRRRLDTPDNFVPLEEELPPDLQALAWRNAAELRHTRRDADFAELVTTLQRHSGDVGPSEAYPPGRGIDRRWQLQASLRHLATRCRSPGERHVLADRGSEPPSSMTETAKMQQSCVIGSYGANLFGFPKGQVCPSQTC